MTPHMVSLYFLVTRSCYIYYHLWNFELYHALSIAQSYFHISSCPQEHFLLLYAVDRKEEECNFFGGLQV